MNASRLPLGPRAEPGAKCHYNPRAMASQRDVQDHYFREAKRAGYVARSAYKLKEIQEKRTIIRRGARVLDLGCAPGAWLQVSCQAIGPRNSGGLILGVDLKPTRAPLRFCDDRVITLEADAFELDSTRIAAALNLPVDESRVTFDVVLSDMMTPTSGHHATDHFQSIRLAERGVELCERLLAGGGSFVVKVFEGELYPQFLDRLRQRFERVKGFKPKASRNESTEMYIIAEEFRRGE